MQYLFPVTFPVMSIHPQHSNIFRHRALSAVAQTQIRSDPSISPLTMPGILSSPPGLLDSYFSSLAVCLDLLILAHVDYDVVY